jgi:NAD(P)H-dependent FMN reductase
VGSIGDRADPTYSDPIVRRWNQTIKRGDAYLVVTPEYNHSIPGVLKNAIDSVFVSFAFRNKPVASIGYSGGIAGGTRAIEHLALVAIEAEMVPLRNSVIIPFVGSAFDESGDPKDPMTDASLRIVLDDLQWWATTLEQARAAGELAPGSYRARAAQAQLKGG